ncbi:uncharacterized aarF domain-containing protein kinase At5g05200, chloroplastic isoform X2 [Malania oleifera]|uniref:uncharacterized aarF domain-containing protein kinase At5g05200, chloroplastic isoform X2 n=1 Tax=Malania oleifera TaxID=397392 RepID=UPI0025AEB62D|nr:uncharacterized aarF domain-containing protein kinase At5g05200, chloroplastic isoform X2 [Malania oleifera]
MVVSAFRGVASARLPLFHFSQLPGTGTGPSRKLHCRSKGFSLSARHSQAPDIFSLHIQEGVEKLPKLVEDIVQASINTGPQGALRLAQGIQAVIGVGGEWLTDLSKPTNTSTGLQTQMQFGLLSPLYLRRLFERMGGTYIKLGQVHGARLKGSREDVVIKVLKPGIKEILIADLNFVYIVARILEFLNPKLDRTSLVGIVKDIRDSMLEEVDFNKEAANIESFRRYLESMGLTRQATAPKVYQQCSTRRVLTMQRLYGVPLTDLDSLTSLVSSPETCIITALNVWFGSLLACETFHADVHAGNLWLLRDGRIGFLDFGIVGHISPKTWAAMDMFLASIATEEYESMASALIEMGAANKDVDDKTFARELEKIFSSVQDLDTRVVVATARGRGTTGTAVSANLMVDERQMNVLFLDVVRVSESYGLRFPREFALLMKQLLYFDRYTRLLAPNLNMLQDQRITIISNRRGRGRDSF